MPDKYILIFKNLILFVNSTFSQVFKTTVQTLLQLTKIVTTNTINFEYKVGNRAPKTLYVFSTSELTRKQTKNCHINNLYFLFILKKMYKKLTLKL